MPDLLIDGVRLSGIDREGLTRAVMASLHDWTAAGRSCTVYAYVNVHAVNLARADAAFRNFLNLTSGLTYCDGEGVRLGARILGVRLPPRIVLTYYLWDLLAACDREKKSVMFLGSLPGVAELAVEHVHRRFPGLTIAGWHHGYFEKSGTENERVIAKIREVSPDLLFVGFGMPHQEEWIGKNLKNIRAGAVLPCGSMIEYAAGKKSLAPSWMADHGMEWLYRLFQEPRRLWRRYLIGNPVFLIRVLFQRMMKGRAA